MGARQLFDGVYDIALKYVRVFVLEDSPAGQTTLVDTGFEDTADYLVETLEDQFGDVDRLILTHSGGDHYGGLDAIVDAFDPTICAASGEEDLLDNIDHEPDEFFEHGDVLDGNIEIVQIPGHSPCPSGLLLRDHDALISSDILDGADRRGLPEGYLLPPPETFNWDHAKAERGWNDLLEYEFDSVLVFHGSHCMEGAREKVDRFINFKEHHRPPLLEEWENR